MTEWQLIETAPVDGTTIIVGAPGKWTVAAYFSQAVGFFPNLGWQSIPGDERYHPTHWKPLESPDV